MSSCERIKAAAQALEAFRAATADVYERYQQFGAGNLEPALFDRVDSAGKEVVRVLDDEALVDKICAKLNAAPAEWRDELASLVETATDLARRCVHFPQGLNFITGEAGMIPRRDQHESFVAALARLGEIHQELVADVE